MAIEFNLESFERQLATLESSWERDFEKYADNAGVERAEWWFKGDVNSLLCAMDLTNMPKEDKRRYYQRIHEVRKAIQRKAYVMKGLRQDFINEELLRMDNVAEKWVKQFYTED